MISKVSSILLAALALAWPPAFAHAQYTLITVTSTGGPADGDSGLQSEFAVKNLSVTPDGRFVAFRSTADNLVPGDTNQVADVFVRDRQLGVTTRVSIAADGEESPAASEGPDISDDGRYVIFATRAALVPEDTHTCLGSGGCRDIYVHDRETGSTSRVSVSTEGAETDGDVWEWVISGNGRYVVFISPASTLVPGDDNGTADVFLRDLVAATTVRLSGATPLELSTIRSARISGDGRVIAFNTAVPAAELRPTADGTPQRCTAGLCPATILYDPETGGTEVLSAQFPPVPNTKSEGLPSAEYRLAFDYPTHMSADGRVIVSTQLIVLSGGVMPHARTLVYDRFTRHLDVQPWNYATPNESIRGLSGDGRHTLLQTKVDPTFAPEVFVLADRISGARETLTPLMPEQAPRAASGPLTSDGREAFFVTQASLVPADTNGAWDVYAYQRDADGDGMLNAWETAFGFNPQDASDATADADSDGVPNLREFQDGTDPKTAPAFRRFLAEGAANAFFTTRIAVLNPNDVPATAFYRFLGSSGQHKTVKQTLQPKQRVTLDLVEQGEAPENDFATVIESDQPLVADRTMTWGTHGYGAHTETSIAGAATSWYLAEGATHGRFDLFYLFQNANDVAATATVTYLRPSPAAPIVKVYTVPANSRATIWVDEEGPELAATDVSARIASDRPIIVERVLYSSTPTQPFVAGLGGVGIATPATSWFLAEGATGSFFDLYLLLANPGQVDADVRVTYLLADGAAFSKSYALPAESRQTISVKGEDPRLASAALSMVVTSTNDQPIVVERSMWWPSPDWYEGHLTAGTTSTGTKWALAEGEVGGDAARSSETYILLANTAATQGSATLTLLVENGAPITHTVVLPAESRVTVGVSSLFPDRVVRRFGTIVESDGVPIVVEQAIYATVDGMAWAAGSAATATKLQ